jgi:hypothetical protein
MVDPRFLSPHLAYREGLQGLDPPRPGRSAAERARKSSGKGSLLAVAPLPSPGQSLASFRHGQESCSGELFRNVVLAER